MKNISHYIRCLAAISILSSSTLTPSYADEPLPSIWLPPTWNDYDSTTYNSATTITHTVTYSAPPEPAVEEYRELPPSIITHTVTETPSTSAEKTQEPEKETEENIPPQPLHCKPEGVSIIDSWYPTSVDKETLQYAHQFATGRGIRVAIIDTGISPHPRLEGRIENLDPHRKQDCDGHGTVVAGIIGASMGKDNFSGIAPDVTLINIPDISGTLKTLATAVEKSVNAGADIINISIVGCFDSRARIDTSPIDTALAYAEEHNVLVISAAGNIGQQCNHDSIVYPAHAETVISVGAIDEQDAQYSLASYSIPDPSYYSINAAGNVPVALAANGPGFIQALGTDRPLHGTSFAAPIISGTAALLKERFPHENVQQLRARLMYARSGPHGVIDIPLALTSNPYEPHLRYESIHYEPPAQKKTMRKNILLIVFYISSVLILVPLVYRASRNFRA